MNHLQQEQGCLSKKGQTYFHVVKLQMLKAIPKDTNSRGQLEQRSSDGWHTD